MSLDLATYRHVFTGGALESWYVAGATTCADATTGTPSQNVLRAIPFIACGHDRTIDRIGMENVNPTPAGNARIGLYTNTSQSVIYPDQLVVDSGLLSTNATGVKTAVINIPLIAGALYWAVHVQSANAGNRCMQPDQLLAFMGITPGNANAMNLGVSAPFPFAALPATFPVIGAALIIAPPIPVIAIRFSA